MSSQIDTMKLSDADIQTMLADAVRLYAGRVAELDGPLSAFPADAVVTAMLKAVNLQAFELGMWQAWSGRS